MSQLRIAATAPSQGMHLGRLDEFLTFLQQRLSADDYAEAESLLHAAIDPVHTARRQREAATR
ncbi:MAG TPA: hypothetical protein VKQ73_02055 [Stellaceae bacterium]|nr:hypothetical protein [Stellaceae bacterium]